MASKQGFLLWTAALATAILKFIEMRFSLEPLTRRDAGQPDITTMFHFTNAPNLNPPAPASQPTGGACYINALP